MEQILLFKLQDQEAEIQAIRPAAMESRTLKIEEDGDPFVGGIKPKIRLKGNWLDRAGFKAGARVTVRYIAYGIIELHSFATASMQNEAV